MKRTTIGLLLMVGSVLVGCGYSGHDACDDQCDCSGCSDRERNDCYDAAETQANRADRYGCGDQYDDVLSCIDDTQYCDSRGHWSYDCGPETSRLAHCLG